MKKFYRQSTLTILLITFSALITRAQSNDVAVPQSDSGQVVFYRVKSPKGGAIQFRVEDSSKESIGTLTNGSVIKKELKPGTYTFTVRTPSVDGTDSITVEVEAGKIYYVKGEILWGWPAGRPKFRKVPEEDAQKDLKKIM